MACHTKGIHRELEDLLFAIGRQDKICFAISVEDK